MLIHGCEPLGPTTKVNDIKILFKITSKGGKKSKFWKEEIYQYKHERKQIIMEYSRSIISDSRVSSINVTLKFCVCVCVMAARLLDSIHKIRFICTPSIKEELKFFTEARYLLKSIVLRDRSENLSPWTYQRMLTNPCLLDLSRRGHRNRLKSSQENSAFISDRLNENI
jgi:hypothetical protein